MSGDQMEHRWIEGNQPDQDPRSESIQIPPDQVSNEAIEQLVEQYLVRDASINDELDPLTHKQKAIKAVHGGQLEIWYNPETEQVNLF